MIIDFIITLYFYEVFIITTIVGFILSPLAFCIPPSKKVYHNIISYLAKNLILYVSGSKLQIYNSIKIDKNKTYLIISNHQSLFDILVLYSLLQDKIYYRWIIKKSLFYIPLFGTLISAAGYIKLDRKNRFKAYKTIKKAIDYIKKGISLIIFPEGTRSLEDTIQPFKSGSMVIATNTGVDLLPVVLKNTLHIKSKKSFLIKPIPIKVKILKPVSITTKMKKDQKIMLDTLRNTMLKVYNKM